MTWLAFLVAVAFVVFVLLAYRRQWRWTGLSEIRRATAGDEDVQPGEDAVGLASAAGDSAGLGAGLAFVLNKAQTEREQDREDDRAKQ